MCPTLCDPVDCSLPGSSIHGILQGKILEWVAISFSRGSSQPRDQTQVSHIAGRCFTLWVTKEAQPEIKFPTSSGSLKKQESSRKTSTSALLTMPKSLIVWTTTNCGKLFKRWEYQTTLPTSGEICMQVKKQQLELDMEQQTGSKLGKDYVKALYCHPAYLTYMQSTSWECWTGWSTSWNQDCWETYQ